MAKNKIVIQHIRATPPPEIIATTVLESVKIKSESPDVKPIARITGKKSKNWLNPVINSVATSTPEIPAIAIIRHLKFLPRLDCNVRSNG